ncbi:MAG: hypothetical protein JO199_14380 [Candidatus Eremiobacteraeota bacterium]|nr:hypothetical protein [Candidatus Eremiobacteraeota bacterium]
MFDVGQSLQAALDGARATLLAAQREVARANAGANGGRAMGVAMATTARAAIFTEALLTAERSRLEELKAVTR